jgi:hypothetical protein
MKRANTPEAGTHREKGQSTLEFALVIGLLLLLLFAVIDFSRLFFAYATMSNGVREGARYGIVHPGQDAAILNQAKAMMVVIGGDATVFVSYPDTAPDPNNPGKTYSYCPHLCRVVVSAESQFDFWTPVLPSMTIQAKSTMHIE